MKALLALLLLCLSLVAGAAEPGRMMRIPTRDGVVVPVFWVPQPNATATVVLLPGGAGGIGTLNDAGWPGSRNFLIRSGAYFADQQFNVAMVSRPSDIKDLDSRERTSEAHMDDLRVVARQLKSMSPAPLWLVGTSRGTISAAAFAISEKSRGLVDGIVLTSSVTSFRTPGAVPTQDLEKITVPVLVMHHEKDACSVCRPYETSYIMKKLTGAPFRKLVMVNGGEGAVGDPCEPDHWHGYIGMEKDAVAIIANWIRQPD
jgi:pimeloyl-ACP methyl ester carboxylesterase